MAHRISTFVTENWLFLVVVAGLVAGFLLLRTQSSAIASVDQMDALLQSGQPVLLELYSNT